MRSPRLSWPLLVGIAVLVAIGLARTEEIRARAEAGLERGMPSREAELAKGFVLGADEGIDEGTKEDFRRAGLSHLLAVSGQNVTLLALLAMPLLAMLGIPLRERLVWVLGLIAIYVPLAGAGPTIQRAAVMGAAGIVATLAGRRTSRLYALALAAVVTLAIDPGIAGDVGWQLSFAAVLGILLIAAPLRRALAGRLGSAGVRGALAEGIAVTVAATLATAPLIAFHFEELSTTTLIANVLALPAVAPAMWLGMASAAAAQVPGFPLEPLNSLDALLLAYVAQVAEWCGAPSWAQLNVRLDLAGLAAAYTAIGVVLVAAARSAAVRRLLGGAAALAAVALSVALVWPDSPARLGPIRGLRVTVLDVGQGDAILLQPRAAPAVLVDGGPSGDGLERKLEEAGVERLGAAIVSHDEADHVGGIEQLLGSLPVARLVYGRLDRPTLGLAKAAGAQPVRVGRGTTLRSGGLRLEVLWPPPELLAQPLAGADPNTQALVLLARWRRFSMLLTADAEAEAVPLDPGQIDVLKVAHHGSEDAGLGPMLDLIRPELAVISVGAENSYGHPTAATLGVLAAAEVQTLRTDTDGAITIEVEPGGISVNHG
jgi:competence protein ComEC